jgi:hypothetical protein
MCWGKLPVHPGRADASPFCGRLPRPHLAAPKLVELRSSVEGKKTYNGSHRQLSGGIIPSNDHRCWTRTAEMCGNEKACFSAGIPVAS